MSERINHSVRIANQNNVEQNNALNQNQQPNVRNSVPNPEVNSLANAVRRQADAVNQQIANQQQNQGGNILENAPNLYQDPALNLNQPQNQPLNSETILSNAKSLNNGNQDISQMDEALFVTRFIQETQGFENYQLTGKDAPNLAKLQELASDCDLDFKIQCAKHFKKTAPIRELRVLYNASTNNAQRAYVDLLISHSFASVFASEINAQLPANRKDPDLEKTLQALIGNYIAASSRGDIADAKAELQAFFNSKVLRTAKPGFIAQCNRVFNNFINGVEANKTAAKDKIAALAGMYNEAVQDISKADPSKLQSKTSPFVSNLLNNGLPSQLGIVSSYDFGNEKSVEYNSFVENKKQIDKLLSEKYELDRILKDSGLKGYTIDQIKDRIRREAFGNDHLMNLVERHENKKFEELRGKVEELFNNPGKNDAFANVMMSVFTQISRDLSSQKAGQMIDILREAFNNFDVAAHDGFSDSLNFRTLKALVLKTGESPELKAQFPEVIRLLAMNRFTFRGFTNISVPAGATEEQKITAAVSMLEEYAKAVSDPNKAKALLSGKLQSAFTDRYTKFAYVNMATNLARLATDPALKQQCGYLKAFVAVKDTVELIKQENNALPAGPDYGADTAEATELLDKISRADLSEIRAEDLKKLLEFAVNIPLPQLNAIWNTVLYAAYHAHMGEQIASGAIADAPSRVYSLNNAEEDPFAGLNGQVDAGVQARNEFINSLGDNVREKMDATGQGVVREKGQISTVDNIAKSLNRKLDDKKALESVLVASDKGKSLLALKEMRRDIYTFGDKWSFSAYDDITDPDELIKIGINKKKLYQIVNKNEKITAEYRAKLEARDEAIGMPAINKLLSAQKQSPDDAVKGENVAVTISLLRDNLVDDASQLDPAILRGYGIDNKDLITFSREELNFAKEYAEYELRKQKDPALPEDQRFPADRVSAFKQKCQQAQAKLEDVLATHANQDPLSKVAKLLINKHMQVSALNNAASLALMNASGKYRTDHPNLDYENLSAEEQAAMNREVRENALTLQNQYIDAVINGTLNAKKDLVNTLVSDLTTKLHIYDMDQIQKIAGATQEATLSVAQKKELISNLKILNQNIDTSSFTAVPEDPEHGKTAFSRDLSELNSASDETFGEKLNAFIVNHLNLENTSTADSLIVYKAHKNNGVADAGKTSVQSALSDAAMQAGAGTNLEKIRNAYISGYGTDKRNKDALELDTQLRKGDSEVLVPIAKDLLGRSAVRDEVRLASSYAAAKLGYASKNELYAAFKDPKTSSTERQKIRAQMMRCLQLRGFDTNMSRLLTNARLTESSSLFTFTKMIRSVKSHFFSAVNDIRGIYRSAKIFFGGLPDDEAEKRSHDYHEYLPAMKEMVSRIGENEIRYVTQNMDFKVNFNPLAAIDLVTGGALAKNDLMKVKASLALNSNAAMAFTRNPDGKLSLLINSNILNVGLEANATFKPVIAGGAKAGAGVSAGGSRVLELKFDNDDEAAAFMCKMYTAQLSSEDVRLASDTASGNSWSINGKVKVSACMSNVVQGFMHTDELEAINREDDDNAKKALIEKYAKDHPLMNNIVKFTSLGALDLSYTYNRDSKTTVDNTGSTHEVRTTHEIGKKIKLFDLKAGSHKIDYTDKHLGVEEMFDVKDAVDVVGDMVISGVTKAKGKSDPKKAEAFAKTVKKIGDGIDKFNQYNTSILKAEHIRSFHTSATTGLIDQATDKTVSNQLTKDDLDELQSKGLINNGMRAKLEKLIEDGDIKQVTFVRTLKPSLYEALKNDKNLLEKACYNVTDNYMLSDVIIESKGGPSTKITNEDWLDIISGGYASYKTENSSSSNNVLRIKVTNLASD